MNFGAGALFDPYSSEKAYLNTQVSQINAGAQQAAFFRLKDFRRIATRYDKLARNYTSAVALAAA